MAFWDADFTTRMGAETATGQAGLACFIVAGFRVVGALFFGGMVGFETLEGQIIAGLTAVEAILAVIAGFRFRAGKGAFIGMVVAAFLALAIVNALVSLTFAGIIFNTVFLIVIVQGIRGALVLRRGDFAEDEVEAFE